MHKWHKCFPNAKQHNTPTTFPLEHCPRHCTCRNTKKNWDHKNLIYDAARAAQYTSLATLSFIGALPLDIRKSSQIVSKNEKKKNQKLKNLDNSCSFATSALSSRKTHTEKMKQTNTSLPQIVAEC